MRAKVTVRLGRIAQNLSALQKNCTLRGISLAAVTKVHAADPAVCGLIASFGVKALADSRIENLESMAALPAEKWLLRVPAPSIAGEVVRFSDLSLNSELSTIRILNREALKQKKLHKVALMWDLGDLREGYYRYADIEEAAREASSMPAIQFCGIATNLNCYGGVDPSVENMEALSEIASRLARSGMPCPIVSGGGSSTYSLLLNGTLPNGITNLRIGDTLYLGRDRLLLKKADGMNDDCFVLTAEVVEVKDKPSVPIGHIGLAALNATPSFVDRGVRKRAILSCGKQDLDMDLTPMDEGAILLGGSSDHLLVDVTDVKANVRAGSLLSFKMGYSAIMRAFTSKYVDKEYLHG